MKIKPNIKPRLQRNLFVNTKKYLIFVSKIVIKKVVFNAKKKLKLLNSAK